MAERAPINQLLEKAFVRCRSLEVPLADRLQAFANEVRHIGPHFAAARDEAYDGQLGMGSISDPGQRQLDAADSRHLHRWD